MTGLLQTFCCEAHFSLKAYVESCSQPHFSVQVQLLLKKPKQTSSQRIKGPGTSLPRLILPSLKRHPMGCTLVTYIGSLFLLSLPPPIVIPKDSFGSFFIATVFSWLAYPWGKSYKGMTVQNAASLTQLTWEARIWKKITDHCVSLIQNIPAVLLDCKASFSCTCSRWKCYPVFPKWHHHNRALLSWWSHIHLQ